MWAACIKIRPAGCRRSGAGATWPSLPHRPFDAELDRERQRYRYRSRRRPTRSRSRQQPPQAPSSRIPRPADARHLAGSHLTPSRSLDLYASGGYHSCSKCFFSGSPHRQRPRRNCLSQPNHGGNLSVYTIYKESHSSDGPATRERHYAGWAADRDDAILRANELYEGRDSTEAVLVIGNGPTEVEVVYRVDGKN
jgi:hypothetical protein